MSGTLTLTPAGGVPVVSAACMVWSDAGPGYYCSFGAGGISVIYDSVAGGISGTWTDPGTGVPATLACPNSANGFVGSSFYLDGYDRFDCDSCDFGESWALNPIMLEFFTGFASAAGFHISLAIVAFCVRGIVYGAGSAIRGWVMLILILSVAGVVALVSGQTDMGLLLLGLVAVRGVMTYGGAFLSDFFRPAGRGW
jgi:hypothetical protein